MLSQYIKISSFINTLNFIFREQWPEYIYSRHGQRWWPRQWWGRNSCGRGATLVRNIFSRIPDVFRYRHGNRDRIWNRRWKTWEEVHVSYNAWHFTPVLRIMTMLLSYNDLFSEWIIYWFFIFRASGSENLRHQRKCIVFLTKLLLLFKICPACKSDNPSVKTCVLGTMIEVTTQCFNPQCPTPQNTWWSQPTMTGTKMPAMNFLLCFSILVSGASPSKIFQVFRNMGLYCISLKTYFQHQAVSMILLIYIYRLFTGWEVRIVKNCDQAWTEV